MDAKKCVSCREGYAAGKELTVRLSNGDRITQSQVRFSFADGDTMFDPKDLCNDCLDRVVEDVMRAMFGRLTKND